MAMSVEKGQLVLVTGATGFIGAHVVEELIAAGHLVRATSRSRRKAEFLVKRVKQKFGAGLLEIVEVPEMVAADAYDSAVRGVDGIIHLASVLTLSSQPEEVIAPTVSGTLNILRSAATEPRVKSVVVTSSSTAVYNLAPNHKFTVTKNTWNEDALEQSKKPSPEAYTIYSASKVEAEKTVWKFVRECQPSFQVCTVLPNANFGTRMKPRGNSTGDWIPGLYNGDEMLFTIAPRWFVNVSDCAKLHVVALIDPACNGQRLFAFAGRYNANDILQIILELDPSRSVLDLRAQGQDLSEVPNEDAEALLMKHYAHGWTSLKQTVIQNLRDVDQ